MRTNPADVAPIVYLDVLDSDNAAGNDTGTRLVCAVNLCKVLVFKDVDVTLQMFHPPTRIRSRL
jgi:hypothetical protein